MRTVDNPRSTQKTAFGGITGVDTLDLGRHGRFTEIGGLLFGEDPASLNAAIGLIRSYDDGRLYVFVDNFNNTFPYVKVDSFEPTGRVLRDPRGYYRTYQLRRPGRHGRPRGHGPRLPRRRRHRRVRARRVRQGRVRPLRHRLHLHHRPGPDARGLVVRRRAVRRRGQRGHPRRDDRDDRRPARAPGGGPGRVARADRLRWGHAEGDPVVVAVTRLRSPTMESPSPYVFRVTTADVGIVTWPPPAMHAACPDRALRESSRSPPRSWSSSTG
jgi:hypothetical protein